LGGVAVGGAERCVCEYARAASGRASRPLGTSGGRSRRSIGRRILRPESDQSRGENAFGR
jgi:hypothetical protein